MAARDRIANYTYQVAPGELFDLASGQAITLQALTERLANVRLLFLGEHHNEPASHQLQADIIRALLDAGRRVTVALEMFSPEADPVLASWTTGQLDEREFLEQSNWYTTWGFAWGYYRDLFHLFRDAAAAGAQIEVRGVNITRAQRREASRGEIPVALQEEMGALDLQVDPHRQYLSETLTQAGHGDGLQDGTEMFQRYLRVQVLWDQAMGVRAAHLADGTARSKTADGRVAEGNSTGGDPTGGSSSEVHPAGKGDNPIVVLLIGSGHLAYKLGANLRAARARPALTQATVLHQVVTEDELNPAGQAAVPLGAADLVWITIGTAPHDKPPQLTGLRLEAADQGVRIAAVTRFAPQRLQVLQEGDLVQSLNGLEVRSSVALRLTYETLPTNQPAQWTVLRQGNPITLSIPVR